MWISSLISKLLFSKFQSDKFGTLTEDPDSLPFRLLLPEVISKMFSTLDVSWPASSESVPFVTFKRFLRGWCVSSSEESSGSELDLGIVFGFVFFRLRALYFPFSVCVLVRVLAVFAV
jgi:hypothetical protein